MISVPLKSTIVSIPKDNKAPLSNSDNYRGISRFIRLINYLTTLFYIYIKIDFNHLICNFDIKKDTLQRL